jgi:pilus assembly protein CpaE
MNQKPIRVIFVDDNSDTRKNLHKIMQFQSRVQVVGVAKDGKEGIRLTKKMQPDIVLMDINMPDMDGITATEILTREAPNTQVIMLSIQWQKGYFRRAMRAGARDFLIKPSTTKEITSAILRVYEARPKPLTAHFKSKETNRTGKARQEPSLSKEEPFYPTVESPPEVKEAEVIAFFAAKGGSGCSTLAVNLAIALQQLQPNARIALVDGNREFGDLSMLLELKSNRTILDLIGVDELDSDYIHDVLIPHASGIKVLPSTSPQEAELVTNLQMKRVIDTLRPEFDFILFDTEVTFREPTLTILEHAHTILLLTTDEISAISNTRLFFDVVTQLDYAADKVRLLLNKYNPQSQISPEAIESNVKHPISAKIPYDELVYESRQRGVPYIISHPQSPFSRALNQFATAIWGTSFEPQANPTLPTEEKKSWWARLIASLFGG